MTRQQSTVIWLGLVLVAFNLIIHIGELKSVIFGGQTPASTPAPPSSNTPNPPLAPGANPTPPNVSVV